MKAMLLGLNAVSGELGDNKSALKAALSKLTFQTPSSNVKLDHHRVAITDTFISQIDVTDDGQHLYTHMLERVPDVNMTLGKTDEEWLAMGNFGVHNIPTANQGKKSFADIIAEKRKQP